MIRAACKENATGKGKAGGAGVVLSPPSRDGGAPPVALECSNCEDAIKENMDKF
jgi:hypothetical protein